MPASRTHTSQMPALKHVPGHGQTPHTNNRRYTAKPHLTRLLQVYPTHNPERDGDLAGGGAAFNSSPEQVRSPRGLPEARMHARAHCEQASKQAASDSYCGRVARVVHGSRRSQLADAAQGPSRACCSIGEPEGGESGQRWRPRLGDPLPEGGRPRARSGPSIENGSMGRGRPGTLGPEEIGGTCRPPVPELVDRHRALPGRQLPFQTTMHAHMHTLGGVTPAPWEGRVGSHLRIVRRRGRLVPFTARLIFRDVWARQARGSPQCPWRSEITHINGSELPSSGPAHSAHPWGKAPTKGSREFIPSWKTWPVWPVEGARLSCLHIHSCLPNHARLCHPHNFDKLCLGAGGGPRRGPFLGASAVDARGRRNEPEDGLYDGHPRGEGRSNQDSSGRLLVGESAQALSRGDAFRPGGEIGVSFPLRPSGTAPIPSGDRTGSLPPAELGEPAADTLYSNLGGGRTAPNPQDRRGAICLEARNPPPRPLTWSVRGRIQWNQAAGEGTSPQRGRKPS